MPKANPKRDIHRNMTVAEKRTVAAIRADVEARLPELMAKGRAARIRHDALLNAMKLLHDARVSKGMSLADVARLSGIDKARLSKLENDPHPNPTLDTLTRIAAALQSELSIVVSEAA